MKIKEGGVMDIQKEREAFEKECRLLCYKGSMAMSSLGNFYNNEQTNWMWQMWLSSKAQAVPEGYQLVKKELNAELMYAVAGTDDINEHLWIEQIYKGLLEAQEATND